MVNRAQELALQRINQRLERSAEAARKRQTSPQPTTFDGVTGGYSGAVPRVRPLGSGGGVLALPQASGALGIGAPLSLVAGIASAAPRLAAGGFGGGLASPEAIRASVLAQTGWQSGVDTPENEGIVARYPYDIYYSALTGTTYIWEPSTVDTPGAWVGVSQQAVGYGAPGSLPIEVVGGTYTDATDDVLYVGGESGWFTVTGGGGAGVTSAALYINTTSALAENTPTLLTYDSSSGSRAWDNGPYWSSGAASRVTPPSAGYYEFTMHSPLDIYDATDAQTEWDIKMRLYNSSDVQQVTMDCVKSWYVLTSGGINALQYFDWSLPLQISTGDYLTFEVQQRNSGTATLRFGPSDYGFLLAKKLE